MNLFRIFSERKRENRWSRFFALIFGRTENNGDSFTELVGYSGGLIEGSMPMDATRRVLSIEPHSVRSFAKGCFIELDTLHEEGLVWETKHRWNYAVQVSCFACIIFSFVQKQ